jgi:hypothetical protein
MKAVRGCAPSAGQISTAENAGVIAMSAIPALPY